MNKYEIYTRVNHESFENVPRLPVYLRSVGYKKLQNGTLEKSTELHSPFFEMIWCKRGVGEVFLYKESFPLLANDIFFYHPNEQHKIHSLSDDFEIYWATFNGPNAVAFFDGYGYSRKMHSIEQCPVQLFEQIRHQISDPSPLTFRSMLALLCQLLALAGGTDNAEKDPVQKALELIRKNLDNPLLNVNFLADELQIHRSTLIDLFRKKLGRLPGLAIRDRRRALAETLLSGTTLPVKEIARRCGIADVSSFCRFFKEKHRMTPLQYRLREKKEI